MRAVDWPKGIVNAPLLGLAAEPWFWDAHTDWLDVNIKAAEEVGADGLEFFLQNFAAVQTGRMPRNKITAFSRDKLRQAVGQFRFSMVRPWGQGQGDPPTDGGFNPGSGHIQRINTAIGDMENWGVTLFIDPWEPWAPGPGRIRNVVDYWRSIDPHGDSRLFCIRSEPGSPPRMLQGDMNLAASGYIFNDDEPLRSQVDDIVVWGQHFPVYWDDRARIDVDDQEKDFATERELAELLARLRQANVGGSFGKFKGPNSTMGHARGTRRFDNVQMVHDAVVDGTVPGDDPPDNGDDDGDTGPIQPEFPEGYDPDHVTAEVHLINHLRKGTIAAQEGKTKTANWNFSRAVHWIRETYGLEIADEHQD